MNTTTNNMQFHYQPHNPDIVQIQITEFSQL